MQSSFVMGFKPDSKYFKVTLPQNKTDFLWFHGHNLDFFNNDDACSIGFLIVSILIFFEAKKRGELLKKIENIVVKDVHLDYLKKLFLLLYDLENSGLDKNKNRIIIHAHTHLPYLDEVTVFYQMYRSLNSKEDIVPKKSIFRKIIDLFFK
jgi:hypothetical protein